MEVWNYAQPSKSCQTLLLLHTGVPITVGHDWAQDAQKHLELWSTAVTYCIDSPAIDAALVNHAKWLDVSEILQELKGLMLQEIRIKAFHEFPRPSLPQPRWEWAMFDEFLRLHHIESTLVHRATAQVFMDILKYIPNWTTMLTECELIHDTQCGNIGLAFFFSFGFPSPMIDGHSCQPIPFRCFYPFGHGTSMEAAIPIIQNQVILPSCNIDEQNEQWYPSPGFFCRIIDTKVTEQNWKNLRRQVLLKTARQSNNKEVQVIGIAGLRQNCHYTLHGGGVLAETACAHWFDTVHQTRKKRWLARTHLSKVLGISYIDKEKAGFKWVRYTSRCLKPTGFAQCNFPFRDKKRSWKRPQMPLCCYDVVIWLFCYVNETLRVSDNTWRWVLRQNMYYRETSSDGHWAKPEKPRMSVSPCMFWYARVVWWLLGKARNPGCQSSVHAAITQILEPYWQPWHVFLLHASWSRIWYISPLGPARAYITDIQTWTQSNMLVIQIGTFSKYPFKHHTAALGSCSKFSICLSSVRTMGRGDSRRRSRSPARDRRRHEDDLRLRPSRGYVRQHETSNSHHRKAPRRSGSSPVPARHQIHLPQASEDRWENHYEIPDTWKPNQDFLDTNLVYGLALPRQVVSTSVSRNLGIDNVPIFMRWSLSLSSTTCLRIGAYVCWQMAKPHSLSCFVPVKNATLHQPLWKFFVSSKLISINYCQVLRPNRVCPQI